MFEMIRNYLKAGGTSSPFIAKFCAKYGIDETKFIAEMKADADGWLAKLKKVGLV